MSEEYKISKQNDAVNLKLSGRFDIYNAPRIFEKLNKELSDFSYKKLILDLSDITYFDSVGAATIIEIQRSCIKRNKAFSITSMTESIKNFLSLIDTTQLSKPIELIPPERIGLCERVGRATFKFVSDTKNIILFVKELFNALIFAVFHPHCVRWGDILIIFEQVGVNAVPILFVIQFLIGVILALLGAEQLKPFGAEIFTANLVAIAMVQELGPMITAVLVAGRSGAAFAAEIGTMKVSEEIDALESLGIDPQHFLVIPRMLAVILAMPCLLLIANVAGISGGIVVTMLFTDIPVTMYLENTMSSINMYMIFQGFFKSIVFAFLVAGVGCMRGFEVKGGAGNVGLSTTSAVVSGIFLIVLFNGIFTLLFNI